MVGGLKIRGLFENLYKKEFDFIYYSCYIGKLSEGMYFMLAGDLGEK